MDNNMENFDNRIGKNLIDILMFSMYPDAKVFYREYIQNAYDSIIKATNENVLSAVKDGNISINIDTHNHCISILDNGIGISTAEAPRLLLNIADGHKNGIDTAGQYGIGRLTGARYCKKLIFKTSTIGEDKYTEITFDTKYAQSIIHDDNDHSTATDVIKKITSVNTGEEDADSHYFEVKMEDVNSSYKELLNPKIIKEYIQEVAPIDYELEFKNILYKNNLPADFALLEKSINNVRISINDEMDIRRRYGLQIDGTGDKIESLHFFKIEDKLYGILGWGWFAITKMSREIPNSDKNRGLRLRKQNIQIGDSKVLNKYFRQGRGNNYFYGEIHATNENLRPDSARDGLAPTPEALAFYEHINEYFADLGSLYQVANKIKNINRDIQVKTTIQDNEQQIEGKTTSKKEVEKKIKELKNVEDKAKKENNAALLKIIEINKKEIQTAIDNSPIKCIFSDKEAIYGVQTPDQDASTKDNECDKISVNNTNTIVDIFEPLKVLYTPEQIVLIRRVCTAFSQNASVEERSLIDQIKKKVIKALSR